MAAVIFMKRMIEISRRPDLRRIVANTFWLFVDKVVYAGVGIFVGAWVARYLRPASFGLLSYALAVVGFLTPVVGLGLRSIVVRDLVREPTAKGEILGTTLFLRFGTSLFFVMSVFGAFLCGIGPENRVLGWLIAIISVQLVFSALGETAAFWFESQLQSKYVTLAKNSAMVLGGAIKISLVTIGAPLIAFGGATVLQMCIFALGMVILFQATGNQLTSLRGRVTRAKQLLSDSWPLMFADLAIMIHLRIDQIMLGHLIDSETLGIYSVAVRLSEPSYFLPVAFGISLFPAIVHSRENQTSEVHYRRTQAFFDLMAGLAYAVAFVFTFTASPLVIAIFGADYADAGPILKVHIWSLVFVSLGVARGKWLLVENRVRFAMFTTIFGGALNIGLNLLLIPKYGGLGAAWATLFSQGAASYLSSLFYVPFWPVFKQATLALFVPVRLRSIWRTFRHLRLD